MFCTVVIKKKKTIYSWKCFVKNGIKKNTVTFTFMGPRKLVK